jgi:AraC-like DNA-binding protein
MTRAADFVPVCRNRIADVKPSSHPALHWRIILISVSEGMRNCVLSVMSDPSTLRDALRAEGVVEFAITGKGHCHARLTQVTLDDLRVATIEETLPRIAFVKVPADRVLISLPLDRASRLYWGSINARADELVTLSRGAEIHTRIEGPCRWGTIWFSVEHFARYTKALLGQTLILPDFASVWRPPSGAAHALLRAHAETMRAAQTRPMAIGEAEPAHGLEQQLVHAAIGCLAGRPHAPSRASQHYQCLMSSLEQLVADLPHDDLTVAALGRALGVSDHTLSRCCNLQLGMSPLSYLRLRRRRLAACAPAAANRRVDALAPRPGLKQPVRTG